MRCTQALYSHTTSCGMNLTLWRLLIVCSLYLVTHLQVTVGRQLALGNVTNSSSEWIGWSEENSIPGVYWMVHSTNSSFNGDVVLLNTSITCSSCSSGSGVVDPQYSLLSPQYMILTNNCSGTISYTLQAEVTVEVIVRSNDADIFKFNLGGVVGEKQTKSLIFNESIVQLIFSVTSNLYDELLLIDDVKCSNCCDVVSPTSSVESSMLLMMDSTIDFDISSTILVSSDGLTASRMLSTSSSQFSVPASSSMMIISSTPSAVLVTTIEQTSTFTAATNILNVTSTSLLPSLSTTTISSMINNSVDVVSMTSLMLHSTTSSMNMSVVDMISISALNTTIILSTDIITMTPSPISTTSNIIQTTMAITPTFSNASQSDDATFFSTNVIIGIAAGGSMFLLILLCLLICCLCCRVRSNRRNKHKFFITNNTGYSDGHKGHSSVYAQERYRHKSRSRESMNGPYHYELPFVHIETAPEAYTHNGDDDTIDSESEDIRRDLKGTPTSSRRESLSTTNEQPVMTSFYPKRDEHHQWSDYNSDNNEDETNSDIVYSNRNPLNEMCGGELPPILSLGDYEDDDNLVIANPYNPTLYPESKHIPNKDESPRRSGNTRNSINLEALTTLESSGEYTPKQSIPNYRRKQSSRSTVGKNLRKVKSEINLEDATKIAGAARYPRHQSKSRIDLKEATKLSHSQSDARVRHQHRKPYHSSSPRMLDSSSKLERLTSLNT